MRFIRLWKFAQERDMTFGPGDDYVLKEDSVSGYCEAGFII